MSNAEPLTHAEKQRQYRNAQYRRGIPTGAQVAMSAWRQMILHCHRIGRDDILSWLARRIERDLKASPTAKHLTRYGIYHRIEAAIEETVRDEHFWP